MGDIIDKEAKNYDEQEDTPMDMDTDEDSVGCGNFAGNSSKTENVFPAEPFTSAGAFPAAAHVETLTKKRPAEADKMEDVETNAQKRLKGDNASEREIETFRGELAFGPILSRVLWELVENQGDYLDPQTATERIKWKKYLIQKRLGIYCKDKSED